MLTGQVLRQTVVAIRRQRWCSSSSSSSAAPLPPPPPNPPSDASPTTHEDIKESSLVEDKSERQVAHATPEELWEKYGVLSEMDGRHKHLTTQEYVALWWKLQELSKAGTTYDIWDIHTTQMQKDNWELNYQLFVNRLPPAVQELYQETFNKKYLTFRPPKVRTVGMPPPQDYLDVWQAEQPTFYITETWPNGITYWLRERFWGGLREMGAPVGMPRSGYAKLVLTHPITNDIPDLEEAYRGKMQPGQVVKLLPDGEEAELPPPPKRFKWFFFRQAVGTRPNYLALPWAEVVATRDEEVQIKVFKGNSLATDPSGKLVPNEDYELAWVPKPRLLLGVDRLDYIALGLPLCEAESRDILRLLWPAPLIQGETVKYHYSQEGYDYPWDIPTDPTHANDFTVDALLLPYEFVSKREPDIPNTLGKIAIVVGDREYPIMVDFWDALHRFNLAHRNLTRKLTQWAVGVGFLFAMAWMYTQIMKYTLVSRVLKPYAYNELVNHPRYKHIYGAQTRQGEDGSGPWAYDKD